MSRSIYLMKYSKKDLIGFVASRECVTAGDVARRFGVSRESAYKRLNRYAKMNLFVIEKDGRETWFHSKRVVMNDVDLQMSKIIGWMIATDHPMLKYVPSSLGGYNEGGGYVYHWKLLLELLKEFDLEEGVYHEG